MKKRIAILLFGLSRHIYQKKTRGSVRVDHRKSLDNYKEYIYNYFEKLDYEIDIYFVSNSFKDEFKRKEVINCYYPKNYAFIRNHHCRKISRNQKFLKVMELCLNENINYDLVLMTRFDLLFKKKFEESNIKLDKFNLVSKLESNNFICDNFYLFPYKYLQPFYDLMKNRIDTNYHYIKKLIESLNGINFVNYILNEQTKIQNLTFYEIVRNKN